MNKLPQEFHADLTEERIKAVGNIIHHARNGCLEHHDEVAGDTNWSYGCRARDWTRQALRNSAANTKEYPFLSILEDNGQKFVIGIAGIPVKFFKDDAEEPNARVRKHSASELSQLSLFHFNGVDAPEDVAWRFVVEINTIDLEVIKVVFVGLDQHEDTLCYYNVPLQDSVAKIYDMASTHEEGVELAAPMVSKKKPKQQPNREAVNDK